MEEKQPETLEEIRNSLVKIKGEIEKYAAEQESNVKDLIDTTVTHQVILNIANTEEKFSKLGENAAKNLEMMKELHKDKIDAIFDDLRRQGKL